MLREYQDTLEEYQKTEPVWWGKQGALTYTGIYQIFHRTAKRAALQNKKFNPHAWRHAFGRDANDHPSEGIRSRVYYHNQNLCGS
jgi:site-specific recombinase XerD